MKRGMGKAPSSFFGWTGQEERFLDRLGDPFGIQAFLDRIPYDDVPGTRSPRWVIRERKAKPGSDTFERFLLAHIREVTNAWRANAQVTVKPHRFRNKMTITVKGGKGSPHADGNSRHGKGPGPARQKPVPIGMH